MSQNSIFDKQWLELVFEGKNKAYGAYQLRRENGRTTTLAFVAAMSLVSLAVATPAVMNAFSPKGHTAFTPPIERHDSIVLAYVEEKKPIEQEKKSEPAAPAAKDLKLKNLSKPVVTEKKNATQEVPTTEQIAPVTVSEQPGTATTGVTGTGTGTEPGTEPGTGGNGLAETEAPAGPMNMGVLDKAPEFPGGLKGFYTYVSRNFKPTEESEEVETKLSIAVSFVVERDGTLTDVKVLRDPGYGLGKEAIRVLKALKTKWEPGIYKGQKVRTLYTLPISVSRG